jgi:hypothetical protein
LSFAIACCFVCHSARSEESPHFAFGFAVACFLIGYQNLAISTEAIHSLTVNRAAEKSAFLPVSLPTQKPFVFS